MRWGPLGASSAVLAALMLGGCATSGSVSDPLAQPATLVQPTKTGVVLDDLPPAARPLDVAVYNFPDLTGQNKSNSGFAEFSRAVTQGGASILIDVLTKAGHGKWFNVVERNDLKSLLAERQIIQTTRKALEGNKARGLPPLRFSGVILDGGIVGYDTDETTGGLGATYLGIGGDTQYRQDIVTVALRAVSVQTGRVLASVTTTKTIYSVMVHGSGFQFVAVDRLLQAEAGFTKNAPTTLAVREGIQLAVYSLIFEGVKNGLWQFQNPAAGAGFMRSLDKYRKATQYTISSISPKAPSVVDEAADQAVAGPTQTAEAAPTATEKNGPVRVAKAKPVDRAEASAIRTAKRLPPPTTKVGLVRAAKAKPAKKEAATRTAKGTLAPTAKRAPVRAAKARPAHKRAVIRTAKLAPIRAANKKAVIQTVNATSTSETDKVVPATLTLAQPDFEMKSGLY